MKKNPFTLRIGITVKQYKLKSSKWKVRIGDHHIIDATKIRPDGTYAVTIIKPAKTLTLCPSKT